MWDKTHKMLRPVFSKLLDSCNNLKTLKQIHASLTVSNNYTGFDNVFVCSKLIVFYTRFHDLTNAVLLFESLHDKRNTFIWNLIIKSHVDLGRFNSAFEVYKRMRNLGIEHDSYSFPIVNRAVSLGQFGIECGEMVHCVAVKIGFESDLYFCNTLIEVYLKFGFVCDAHKVFDDMYARDIVSWTSMISGFVMELSAANAFKLFEEMRIGLEPNSVTVIIMLQLCSSNERVFEGKQIHGYVINKGHLFDGSVKNSLLRMYALMGLVRDVEELWGEMVKRDFVSWNIMISFYASIGDSSEVGKTFKRMQSDEIEPSVETLTLAISAITKTKDGCSNGGNMFHCYAIKSGLYDNVLKTCLLDFYAKYENLEASVLLFSEISFRNSITWNAMMCGFIQNGYFKEAIDLFPQMQASGLKPKAEILNSLVIAYTHLGMLQLGKVIHGYVTKILYDLTSKNNSILQTSLLNMYLRCGSISYAKKCFDQMIIKDIVTWTSMIEGFGTHGLGYEALKIFHQMVEESKLQPNSTTFLSLLSACSHSGLVIEGSEAFNAMKWVYGIEPDLVHYTCMVDLLGRYGKLKEALVIILKMVIYPDCRIWGALFASARVYEDKKIREYAAENVLKMEPDNVGYYTLLSNVNASDEKWGEVEEVRRKMNANDLKKMPAWSCVEQIGC